MRTSLEFEHDDNKVEFAFTGSNWEVELEREMKHGDWKMESKLHYERAPATQPQEWLAAVENAIKAPQMDNFECRMNVSFIWLMGCV